MATKAELEQENRTLQQELSKYKGWLLESQNESAKLSEQLSGKVQDSHDFRHLQKELEQKELFLKSREESLSRLKEKEIKLQDKILSLSEENRQLKESLKNKSSNNETPAIRNPRNAGRHPKPADELRQQLEKLGALLKNGKRQPDICQEMGISRATFYRLKSKLNQ